mmetsp:Transcript_10297/g.33230  ORF Transcript_10297/g.33230 Transcript_10297/m.33230 type:complete len:232 (+) Transcript_10297:318-1013(+)
MRLLAVRSLRQFFLATSRSACIPAMVLSSCSCCALLSVQWLRTASSSCCSSRSRALAAARAAALASASALAEDDVAAALAAGAGAESSHESKSDSQRFARYCAKNGKRGGKMIKREYEKAVGRTEVLRLAALERVATGLEAESSKERRSGAPPSLVGGLMAAGATNSALAGLFLFGETSLFFTAEAPPLTALPLLCTRCSPPSMALSMTLAMPRATLPMPLMASRPEPSTE